MKKVFTFIVSAMLAGSAMAAPAANRAYERHASVNPTKVLNSVQYDKLQSLGTMTMEAPEGMQRSMTDGPGNTWSVAFYLMGGAAESLGLYHEEDGVRVYDTFEDFPMYLVQIPMSKGGSSDPTRNQFGNFALWPCRSYMYSDLIIVDEDSGELTGEIDWTKAQAKFGSLEAAQAPMSIEEVMAYSKAVFQTTTARIPVMRGFYVMFPTIVDYSILSSRDGYVWNGTAYDMQPSAFTTSGINWNSYIEIRSFDPDLKDMSLNGNYKLGVRNQSTGDVIPSVTASFALSGNPALIGFVPVVIEDFTLHLFDCGLVDINSMWGMNYDLEFEPVQRYFAMWCAPDMSYIAQDSEGNIHYAWNKETIADLTSDSPYPVQPFAFRDTENFTFFNAALFTEAGAACEGVWKMPEPKFDFNSTTGQITEWLSVPTPHELVCANYNNTNSEQDGFSAIVNAYYVTPEPNMSAIGVQDAANGFNFKYTAQGWGENVIMGATTAPYVFHYDSTDFDKMEQKPSVGTANANVIDMDMEDMNSSVEFVESNAPVVSTQYFNLQGQRLNAAPQHGIFIQREIKADGTAKATKVAK